MKHILSILLIITALLFLHINAAASSQTVADIDISSANDGFVRVAYFGNVGERIKVLILRSGGTEYRYDLSSGGEYETFPLSEGDGDYTIAVYRNVEGCRYALVCTTSVTVALTDEFAPFLRPNKFVNYSAGDVVAAKTSELTENCSSDAEKIRAVYKFVTANIAYDREKALAITSGKLTGYVPNLDEVLETRRGICFDYASLMAAMLRSAGVPCKLIVGIVSGFCHAWVEAYDDGNWRRFDPTFAAVNVRSIAVVRFISDDRNYSALRYY